MMWLLVTLSLFPSSLLSAEKKLHRRTKYIIEIKHDNVIYIDKSDEKIIILPRFRVKSKRFESEKKSCKTYTTKHFVADLFDSSKMN